MRVRVSAIGQVALPRFAAPERSEQEPDLDGNPNLVVILEGIDLLLAEFKAKQGAEDDADEEEDEDALREPAAVR
jgi:hypothetical protein